MARSALFNQIAGLFRTAQYSADAGVAPDEALGLLREGGAAVRRRRLLQAAAGGAAALALPLRAAPGAGGAEVAVVGAGLAGLYAATVLAAKGARPTLYEAGDRVGGRQWSLRGVFPGQVAERGGELIDTGHTTMRGLVNAFGLTLESYAANQHPGDEYFRFFGQAWTEAQVVAEFRAFVPVLKNDLTRLSNGPTAMSNNAHDRLLDRMPLSDYLAARGAGPLIRRVLDVAYTIEYGRETSAQSALSFLFFVAANRRSTFTPFGVFSDERFHVVEGNDRIATGLAAGLPSPVLLGHRLLRVGRVADGRLKLSFDAGGRTIESTVDQAILALPAPLMREVIFDPGVGLGEGHQRAIAQTDYGTNSKLMVAFRGRPWWERHASSGAGYADLPSLQSTWETNPSQALNSQRGLLTDYTGGGLGERLDPARTAQEAEAFLANLDQALPGSAALALRDARRNPVAHLENWSRLPLFKGAYTNNQPGYFTTLEGLYAQPGGGGLYFAGEHTDSFYSWQGFMEGALLSGARAAEQALRRA